MNPNRTFRVLLTSTRKEIFFFSNYLKLLIKGSGFDEKSFKSISQQRRLEQKDARLQRDERDRLDPKGALARKSCRDFLDSLSKASACF
ncbi:hypothetical protein [Guptibacillus algicola]|uniref:hypothetical protein n=1 Tax=Guptibacillus algicola TaxID=225844 RepID=UPI001CD3F515|nr:hypothetical protein [Alkalihalobacillus algicola]MCA0986483.1 hypothetical protein [Alkalihalobacillus algicola]